MSERLPTYQVAQQVLDHTSYVLSSTSQEELNAHLNSINLALEAVNSVENDLQMSVAELKSELIKARGYRRSLLLHKETCRRNWSLLKNQEPKLIIPPQV